MAEAVMGNLVARGNQGKVYPVNSRRDTIMGLKAYPHVDDLAMGEKVGFSHFCEPGLVIPENRRMLQLGKKIGFELARGPGFSEYELKIDLSTIN
ncbi:MAG: hypothetical protein GY737_19625 [Desulfobacteraceae bacterium]|nr:hypothetical protein [Desulfobacteraceae bacterium]